MMSSLKILNISEHQLINHKLLRNNPEKIKLIKTRDNKLIIYSNTVKIHCHALELIVPIKGATGTNY